MKYFLDTEFMEDGRTIELLSIGVVAEDGREFYRESVEAEHADANDWVAENVIPQLGITSGEPGHFRDDIAFQLFQFVKEGKGEPEFWGYYADYDWVALCQLFGTMMDLPDGWPMFCMDLKQLAVEKGDPELPKQDDGHHALADARWNKRVWELLSAPQG